MVGDAHPGERRGVFAQELPDIGKRGLHIVRGQ